MAVPVEESVLNALRGHLSENTKLPAPLIIKVYVASLKKGSYIYFFILSQFKSPLTFATRMRKINIY